MRRVVAHLAAVVLAPAKHRGGVGAHAVDHVQFGGNGHHVAIAVLVVAGRAACIHCNYPAKTGVLVPLAAIAGLVRVHLAGSGLLEPLIVLSVAGVVVETQLAAAVVAPGVDLPRRTQRH